MDAQRIAVIEDQEEVRENLMETLELADYKVRGASNGHEGVELIRSFNPHLVICDVMMPKLDGFGVLELLQKDPKTANIPFVFLTARAEREDLRRGMNLGASDYITKPFFQDELLKVVALRVNQQKPEKSSINLSSKAVLSKADVEQKLQLLLDLGRLRKFTDRAIVYYSGDKPHSVYYVKSGRVRLFLDTDFGKSLTIDTIGQGGWFAVEDVLARGTHSCSASGFNDAELVLIDRQNFEDSLQRNPELTGVFAMQMSQDLALRAEQLLQIAYFSVRKRVAEYLLRLAEQGVDTEDIPRRREDIAEAVGSTAESVTRVLTEFRKEGLITLHSNGAINVNKEDALREVPA